MLKNLAHLALLIFSISCCYFAHTQYSFIENCVFNMLPNGFPKKHLVKRLKVYQGDQHPHAAQDPKPLPVL